MNMVKSRILRHNTLSSTVIGVVPEQADTDVSKGGLGLGRGGRRGSCVNMLSSTVIRVVNKLTLM